MFKPKIKGLQFVLNFKYKLFRKKRVIDKTKI